MRKSLKTTDRRLAEKRAKEVAREVAELRLTGIRNGLTLAQLFAAYKREKLPTLSDS